MIGFLLPLFGAAIPKWMSPAIKWAIDIALVLALLAGLWALHGHWQRQAYNRAFDAGWAALKAKDDAAVKAAEQLNAKATAKADTERVTDTAKIQSDKDERDAAIKKAPASSIGAASAASNCVRWKRAHSGQQAPAACR